MIHERLLTSYKLLELGRTGAAAAAAATTGGSAAGWRRELEEEMNQADGERRNLNFPI
jgi:hypothetical protein